jgi:hypothetical protein
LTQTPETQSVPDVQTRPPHGVHEPPQSMSASEPFRMPSEHVAAAHVVFTQWPLTGTAQSAFEMQPMPTAHFAAQDPPQSMSVSVPFFRRSEQVAAAQTFAMQACEMQSGPIWQP